MFIIFTMFSNISWQLTSDVTKCNGCKQVFNNNIFQFLSDKHNCRWCGLIFCNRCCNNKNLLPISLDIRPELTFYEMLNCYWYSTKDTTIKQKQITEQRTCNYCHLILNRQNNNIENIKNILNDKNVKSKKISDKLYAYINKTKNY